ncbi:MAG: HAMP domain-containing histidine kinase [Christensenellaceae bacterium]|nr:HAMP domain-containing histidine kinase [Christensenellaceae bacterium]
MKLRTKLIWYFVIFSVFIIVMLYFLTSFAIGDMNENDIVGEQQQIKEYCEILLNRQLIYGVDSLSDVSYIADELHTILTRPTAVYSEDGQMLYATVGFLSPKRSLELNAARENGAALSIVSDGNEMDVYLSFYVPLMLSENGIFVRVYSDYTSEYMRTMAVQTRITIGSAICIFILFVIIIVTVLRALMPVRKLTYAVNDYLEKGVFTPVETKTKKDEIGIFASGFNRMTRTISDQLLAITNEKTALAEALRYRKAFYDKVTHELKTPITIISGYADLMKNDPDNKELAIGALNNIEKETERLHAYVTEILDASKQTMRERMNLEDVDLSALTRRIAESMAVRARRYDVDFHLSIEADLHIKADAEKIRQMLVNLLDNAIKYGLSGFPVNISLQKEGVSALIRIVNFVEDKIGDPESLFMPYMQASSEHESGSVGLGLPISREIALAHSGSIHAEMRNDRQIEFAVKLPLLRYADEAE